MGFIIILILTTLMIAGSAAFFSVYGLAQIFTGSFIPVVVMASSLEVGKLVAASYVYRYWKKIGFLMKTYLITAILVLMVITSAGIFGFLSSAYQQDILPLEEIKTQIEIYDNRKVEIDKLKLELNAELKRMDDQIDAIPGNHSTNRRKMREEQAPDRERIRQELTRLSSEFATATTEQSKLKTTILQQEAHTGPIIFIAKAFDREVDDATKWMILLIIFAFDPLAVILTIGANIALVDRQMMRGKTNSRLLEAYEEAVGIDPEQFDKPEDEEDEDEPDPMVKSVDQLLEQPTDSVSSQQIQKALEELRSKEHELTPSEIAQRGMLEEMLKRKQVTERIRRGK